MMISYLAGYRAWLSYSRFVFQVATPLQVAKCEILAFPWPPDVLAMCNVLAATGKSAATTSQM